MKRHATVSNTTNTQRQSHAPKFTRVFDGRKQPIRGLWVRNGRYYAQLSFTNDAGVPEVRRVALLDKGTESPVSTVAQAVAELNRLKTQRDEDTLPVLKQTPRFAD